MLELMFWHSKVTMSHTEMLKAHRKLHMFRPGIPTAVVFADFTS